MYFPMFPCLIWWYVYLSPWSPQAERNEWWWASTIETWCTYSRVYTSTAFGAIHFLFCFFLEMTSILKCCLYKDWLSFLEYFMFENWCSYTLHFTCYNGSLPFFAIIPCQPSVNWADDPGDSWIRIIAAAWLRCTTHMKSFKGTLGARFDRCLMIFGSNRFRNGLVLSNWMNWIHLSDFHKEKLRVPPLAKFPACRH